jgi:transposase
MQTLLLKLHQFSQNPQGVVRYFPRWQALFEQIIDRAWREEPPPQGLLGRKPRHSKGACLLRRLRKYAEAVLAFAQYPEVPFTNNQAERDLRPAKTKLKIAGCFRTFRGAQIYARITSFLATLRKQGKDLWQELSEAIRAAYNLPKTAE